MIFKSRKRNAFTLLELLISIMIIAVLLGLLIPAVQKVRESANRMVCQNSLRQQGLAMYGYLTSKGKFPVAGEYLDTNKITKQTLHSFQTSILPYLDNDNLHSQIDFSKPYNHPNNIDKFKGVVLFLFICPTNPARSDNLDPDGFGCVDYGTAPYTNISPLTGIKDANYTAETALGHKTGRAPGAIIDGTSNCIAVYEDVGRSWIMSASRYIDPVDNQPRRFWRFAEPDNASGMSGKINNCVPNLNDPYDLKCPWINHDLGMNNEPFSFHSGGGCNVLFCDSHVKWVSDTLDPVVLRAIATHNGREIIPEFD